mmetsp:Transcript_155971/g.500074  ORF Transcript_155971/g.500074 Transcript_155971/m.500074 type:complete len:219 (+) Transcript_155971:1510-2166(+)
MYYCVFRANGGRGQSAIDGFAMQASVQLFVLDRGRCPFACPVGFFTSRLLAISVTGIFLRVHCVAVHILHWRLVTCFFHTHMLRILNRILFCCMLLIRLLILNFPLLRRFLHLVPLRLLLLQRLHLVFLLILTSILLVLLLALLIQILLRILMFLLPPLLLRPQLLLLLLFFGCLLHLLLVFLLCLLVGCCVFGIWNDLVHYTTKVSNCKVSLCDAPT